MMVQGRLHRAGERVSSLRAFNGCLAALMNTLKGSARLYLAGQILREVFVVLQSGMGCAGL
jgi:hypothetical protein